ncbi:MAG: CC0125/CC1285 family lipoprotein [bacterium]
MIRLAFSVTILSVTILALMSACASAPIPYQTASTERAYGYRDYPIEENRYRVTYRAASAAEAESRALRRAAEITLQQGYDWFEVIRTDPAQSDNNGVGSNSRVSIGGSTGIYGRRSGTSIGIGVGVPLGTLASGKSYVANLEILMYRGTKSPAANAYDAKSIMAAQTGR